MLVTSSGAGKRQGPGPLNVEAELHRAPALVSSEDWPLLESAAIEGEQIDQEEVVTAAGQIDQVGVEAVQRVQGESGAGGVIPLICEQGTNAFQALQVTGPPAGGGRLGLTEERDPRSEGLRAFAGGQSDDVDLVFVRPAWSATSVVPTEPGSPPGSRVWA